MNRIENNCIKRFLPSNNGSDYLMMMQFVAENNRTAIEATLVNYYNAKSRLDHSYLDIVQTICSEVTSFCPGGGGAATEVPKVRH